MITKTSEKFHFFKVVFVLLLLFFIHIAEEDYLMRGYKKCTKSVPKGVPKKCSKKTHLLLLQSESRAVLLLLLDQPDGRQLTVLLVAVQGLRPLRRKNLRPLKRLNLGKWCCLLYLSDPLASE